jgi:hypothetical protein
MLQSLSQGLDGAVGCHLEGGYRTSTGYRRLLQGHFFDLDQPDGLPLVGRKVFDRGMQGGVVCGSLINREVRRIRQKGFMIGRHFDFARSDTHLAPQAIDDPAIGDSHKPRSKRTAWIVGMTDGMHRQKHVLHGILDIATLIETPCGQRAQERRHVLKQSPVCLPVSVLSASHEIGPRASRRRVPLVRGTCRIITVLHATRRYKRQGRCAFALTSGHESQDLRAILRAIDIARLLGSSFLSIHHPVSHR